VGELGGESEGDENEDEEHDEDWESEVSVGFVWMNLHRMP
jgi:hypothetical protein